MFYGLHTLLLVSSMYCTGGGLRPSTSRWIVRPATLSSFFHCSRCTTPLLFLALSLSLRLSFGCSVGGSVYYVLSLPRWDSLLTTHLLVLRPTTKQWALTTAHSRTLRDNTATVLHLSLSLPILLLFSVSVRSRVSCAGGVRHILPMISPPAHIITAHRRRRREGREGVS